MLKASLGEAQAVFASRAEVRHTSPKLVAALHCGASGGVSTSPKPYSINPTAAPQEGCPPPALPQEGRDSCSLMPGLGLIGELELGTNFYITVLSACYNNSINNNNNSNSNNNNNNNNNYNYNKIVDKKLLSLLYC